jgi:hypothetical protein
MYDLQHFSFPLAILQLPLPQNMTEPYMYKPQPDVRASRSAIGRKREAYLLSPWIDATPRCRSGDSVSPTITKEWDIMPRDKEKPGPKS